MTQVAVDILDLAPQLDTLDIEIGGPTLECDPILQTLFQRLVCPSTDSKHGPFLAQLAHIRICITDILFQQPFRFMDSVFFDVVSSRWGSHILKSVSMFIVAPAPSPGWGLTVQHIKTLRRFKKEGLDIKISVSHHTIFAILKDHSFEALKRISFYDRYFVIMECPLSLSPDLLASVECWFIDQLASLFPVFKYVDFYRVSRYEFRGGGRAHLSEPSFLVVGS
ncbi:hypothetical protein F5146DRAFT_1142622 [Armillaria mellea]|nr:hypothetical protein F5146DRAFT_1142622 [Armillaria mellea]